MWVTCHLVCVDPGWNELDHGIRDCFGGPKQARNHLISGFGVVVRAG